MFEQRLNNKQFCIRFMSEEEFDYFDAWEDQDKKEVKKVVDEFSKGYPRQGLKGKYIKANTGRVSVKRIKNSYGKYFKSQKED